MSIEESVHLLQNRAGFDTLSTDENSAAEELARQLGFLPLALDSAAAFVQCKRLSFCDYLSIFQERTEYLLRYPRKWSNYPVPIFASLDINFDEVEKES